MSDEEKTVEQKRLLFTAYETPKGLSIEPGEGTTLEAVNALVEEWAKDIQDARLAGRVAAAVVHTIQAQARQHMEQQKGRQILDSLGRLKK